MFTGYLQSCPTIFACNSYLRNVRFITAILHFFTALHTFPNTHFYCKHTYHIPNFSHQFCIIIYYTVYGTRCIVYAVQRIVRRIIYATRYSTHTRVSVTYQHVYIPVQYNGYPRYIVQCTLHFVQYTLCNVHCSVYSVHRVHGTPDILYRNMTPLYRMSDHEYNHSV